MHDFYGRLVFYTAASFPDHNGLVQIGAERRERERNTETQSRER